MSDHQLTRSEAAVQLRDAVENWLQDYRDQARIDRAEWALKAFDAARPDPVPEVEDLLATEEEAAEELVGKWVEDALGQLRDRMSVV
jgi:hypothetical protein